MAPLYVTYAPVEGEATNGNYLAQLKLGEYLVTEVFFWNWESNELLDDAQQAILPALQKLFSWERT